MVNHRTQTNGMGTAGFVVSLIGVLSCGLLSPVGAVLSAVGLRQEPKGLAIAGLVLGIFGSLGFIMFGLGMFMAMLGLAAVAPELADAAREVVDVNRVRQVVVEYRREHGALPDEIQFGELEIENPGRFRYTVEDGEFEIRSAGFDGLFDTDDDIVTRN